MGSIEQQLRERRLLVERALEEVLTFSAETPPLLAEALRYSVMMGGKRLRPILCLAACESVGQGYQKALPPALAVELLHNYTLVHDDLPSMDNDLLRRGQPTVHARFGEAIAVLVGDALQAMAFGEIARSMPPMLVQPLVAELAAAAGPLGVVAGQVADIANSAEINEADVAFVHQHKTADLFRAALRMGAIAGSATASEVESLGRYGNHLGVAFQIADDLLDGAGGEAKKEFSCLGVWSMEEARQRLASESERAVAALSEVAGVSLFLREIAQFLQQRTV